MAIFTLIQYARELAGISDGPARRSSRLHSGTMPVGGDEFLGLEGLIYTSCLHPSGLAQSMRKRGQLPALPRAPGQR